MFFFWEDAFWGVEFWRTVIWGMLYNRMFRFIDILNYILIDWIYSQQTLCEHLEEQNVDGFTEAVKDYDSISRLDQWYTTILLRIKKQANDNPDLR